MSTFDVDGLYIGVRSNTTSVDDVLRTALAAHLVDNVEAPANYSVQLGESSTSGAVPASTSSTGARRRWCALATPDVWPAVSSPTCRAIASISGAGCCGSTA